MDKADEELRETIRKLWPLQSAKKINLLVPLKEGREILSRAQDVRFDRNFKSFLASELHGTPAKRKLTVGKIYAGLLILENFRAFKQSLAKNGEGRPRQSSFFNKLMGVVRSNASHNKSNSTINLDDFDHRKSSRRSTTRVRNRGSK